MSYSSSPGGLGQAYQKSNQRQEAIEPFKLCRDVSQSDDLRKQALEALAALGEQQRADTKP